jgi:hypothetical protein
VAAVACCLAIPLTVGITGLSDLGALGANAGLLVVAATAITLLSMRGSDG